MGMRILVLEKDKVVRDRIVIGLQNFPEFAVDAAEGFPGLHQTRQKAYDCLFIGCNPEDGEGLELIERFREFDRETDVILVTSHKKTKLLTSQRGRYNLLSILHLPIDPKEFFRLVARIRKRNAAPA